ncbi:MAG: hypothetical protein LC789_15370 [Actinobacteria bacterium]|nr:hypothetical protein [Actinomycetota bacterium]MCA1722101.1 hypothetical protein [Actinomycetota bacterium]
MASIDDDQDVLDLVGFCGTRPSAVLVREILLSTSLAGDWRIGPAPFLQPTNESTERRGNRRTTDADARRSLIGSQQAAVLYGAVDTSIGRGGRPASTRKHQLSPGWTCGGMQVAAVEVLLFAPIPEGAPGAHPNGLLAVHVAATEEPLEALREGAARLSDAVHPSSPRGRMFWQDLADRLAPGVSARGPLRAMSFDQLDSAGPANTEALARAYQRVTGAAEITAHLKARAERHKLTIARPDWSALVLRDGGAFVAHQTSGEPFAPTLRTLVHTVYLDALLLAWTQRRLLDDSDRRATEAQLVDPTDLVSLESHHFDFKRTYWRTSITQKRHSPTDDLYRAFQNELLTPLDVADVEDRVREGARLARTLHAERAERAQEELTRMVRNGTIVIGSFSLAFTAAPVLAGPSLDAFLWAALIAAAGIVLAFTVLHLVKKRGGS